MFKRFLLLCLSLILLTASLSAESFVIRSYSFDISGKTQERVVRNLVVPDEEESFPTLEEAVAALDGKKQTLDNRRVFKSVQYTYKETSTDDVTYLDVTFDLDDARTVLVLPYPKYDSNYGARLGVKFWETNLLGTFSSLTGVVHATVMPWEFDKTDYYATLDLDDLLIGQTRLSLSFEGEAYQHKGVDYYDFNLGVSNIVFGSDYSMDLDLGFRNKYGEFRYTGYAAFNGLRISSVKIRPSLSFKIFEKSKSDSYITPSLSISGITVGNADISLGESVYFYNSEKFGFYEFDHSTSLSFSGGSLQKYGYSNYVVYRPSSYISFKNTFSYRLSDITTIYVYENPYWKKKDGDFYFRHFDTGVGISQKISIGEHITITPTLSEYVRTFFEKGDATPNFQPYYTLSASASGNYLDWKGNFREGIKYSFSISESWAQNYTSRSKMEDCTNLDIGEIQIFKVFGSWFNPSLRVIANYTTDVNNYGFLYGTNNGELGEYIRGVRNRTITDDKRDNNVVTFVANLNLMSVFPLPSFMSSWMDAYVNLFADYVFTKHGLKTEEGDVARHYFGFGLEGIGILKEYPSYPVRASLGFDLRKLIQYANGESSDKGFYEIYIGLGFFF